jgi:hypothetical protein
MIEVKIPPRLHAADIRYLSHERRNEQPCGDWRAR